MEWYVEQLEKQVQTGRQFLLEAFIAKSRIYWTHGKEYLKNYVS
jgi:alpha-mannosidase